MNSDDDDCEPYDGPTYRLPETIAQSELRAALDSLALFGSDPNFRNQAFNIALVDEFVMKLELNLLRQQFQEERTPIVEAAFVSAQSQMWIFAAYELMRTWRQRASDMIKWADNGGLEVKLAHLKRKTAYVHFGREFRAKQIEHVLASPALLQKIRDDLRRTYIPFTRMEAIRVSIAKHEFRGQKNSVALMPTHGRINRWCGSIDFELENEGAIMGTISRRDIADELRIIPDLPLPTDEDIRSFDDFMRGPPDDLDWGIDQDTDSTAQRDG
jgi:hypothetical protein